MPKSIVDRSKQGFAAPIHEWLRGPLAPMVNDLFLDGRLRTRGVFDDADGRTDLAGASQRAPATIAIGCGAW